MSSDFATVFGVVVAVAGIVWLILTDSNPAESEQGAAAHIARLEAENADLREKVEMYRDLRREYVVEPEAEPDDLELYGGAQTFSTPFDAMCNGTPAPDGSGLKAVI